MVWFHFYEISRMDKFAETERFRVTRGWGKGEMGSFLLNGCRVFGRGCEKVVEIDCGSACTTLWIPLLPLKYMLKNGWNGKFCYTQTAHTVKKKKNHLIWPLEIIRFISPVKCLFVWCYWIITAIFRGRVAKGDKWETVDIMESPPCFLSLKLGK